MTILMKCGHTANATTYDQAGHKIPACAICLCTDIEENKPDLTGRIATCTDCHNTVKSNYDLPFFEYRPKCEYDLYYCGCNGWD